jgi:hypothetical protein
MNAELYDILIVLIVSSLLAMLMIGGLLKQSWLFAKGRSMVFLMVNYTLFFSTFFGSLIAVVNLFYIHRLRGISFEIKFYVFASVSYSLFIIFAGLYFFEWIWMKSKFGKVSVSKLDFAYVGGGLVRDFYTSYRLSFFVTLVCLFYTAVKYLLYFKSSPIYFALSGDIVSAALSRAAVQTGVVSLDIPYVSKTIYIFSLTICLFNYACSLVDKRFKFAFYISFVSSFFYLIFEMEKGPVIFLLLMFVTIKYFLLGFNKKLFFTLLALIAFVLSAYFFAMGGDSNPLLLIERVLDRILIGQNQAMYFMFQNFEPNMRGVFSDFFFASQLGLDEIKPDERILPYIYTDTSHLINANTFFIGEAWSFFGVFGVIFSPFLVLFCVFCYWKFFELLSAYHMIFWFLGFVFFTTLPLNQSLQFIVYQKYFLYFLVFGVVPFFFLITFYKLSYRYAKTNRY